MLHNSPYFLGDVIGLEVEPRFPVLLKVRLGCRLAKGIIMQFSRVARHLRTELGLY